MISDDFSRDCFKMGHRNCFKMGHRNCFKMEHSNHITFINYMKIIAFF